MKRMRKDPKTGKFVKHKTPNICIIKGCSGKVRGKNMCNMHYLRLTRYGDPTFRNKAANGEGGLAGGYRKITVNGKRTYEHRHIMEQHIGRPLNPGEIVHHKDGDKLNNSIKNLELTNRREHIFNHPEVLGHLTLGPQKRRWTRH